MVITGAGFSRRFGADKRVQKLPGTQTTVAQATVARYAEVFDRIRVVIRDEDKQLRTLLTHSKVELVTTADAHLGHAHSLQAGFQNNRWDYTFIALLDMPFVQPTTLHALSQAAFASPEQIHRPKLTDDADVEQPWGHPIGFPAALYAEILRLEGDQGARPVLNQHAELIRAYPTADHGVVDDVDTPADLARLSVS